MISLWGSRFKVTDAIVLVHCVNQLGHVDVDC